MEEGWFSGTEAVDPCGGTDVNPALDVGGSAAEFEVVVFVLGAVECASCTGEVAAGGAGTRTAATWADAAGFAASEDPGCPEFANVPTVAAWAFAAFDDFAAVWSKPASCVPVCAPATGGTVPVPGEPIPGLTTPCCKLPKFGWAAEGAERVELADWLWLAGNCKGGSEVGTGIALAPAVVLASGCGSGLGRLNTLPRTEAEAAGAGAPVRFFAAAGDCTSRMTASPCVLRV